MGYIELCGRVERERIRWLARKRMHPEFRQDQELRTMFMDEGRLGMLIQHPNIVRVLEVGEDGRGPFLNMEYVEGVALAALLRRAVRTECPVPTHIAVRICRDIALGLHAAHELRGPDERWLELVHRDVSPSNVLIGFDGSVRLTDFGIAKALDNVGETYPGVVKGTRGYLSPEQLRGDAVDRRSDLFSLGVVLYELLTGTRLYGGRSDTDARHRLLIEPPPTLPNTDATVSAPLGELIGRLLAKDPGARPATALEVAAALESAVPRSAEQTSSLRVAAYVTHHFAQKVTRIRELLAEKRQELKDVTPGPEDPTITMVSATAATLRAMPSRVLALRYKSSPVFAGAALVVAIVLALVTTRRPAVGTAYARPSIAVATSPRGPEILPLAAQSESLASLARPLHKRRATLGSKAGGHHRGSSRAWSAAKL